MDIRNPKVRVLVCTQFDPAVGERIRARFPGIEVEVVTSEADLLTALPEADILYIQKELTPAGAEKMGRVFSASKRLKWLHWGYAGPDRLRPFEPLWSQFLLTTSKGMMAATIADYVILAIHLLHREFLRVMKNQLGRVWERWAFNTPRGKTVGIIGLGSIGKEVARRAKCFDMPVIGLVRRPVALEDVERTFPRAELREFLGRSDIVVLCAPLTPETRGLIGAEALSWMKPGSYLVNVARGRIVEEGALVEALRNRHLAGAALDAFSQEPLPPESELWSLDNVILTPHLSGLSSDYPERVLHLFCENLERFLHGEDLVNRVEAEKGY